MEIITERKRNWND